MTTPNPTPVALIIVVPLEGRTRVIPAAMNESEFDRLCDWLDSSDRRLRLLELAVQLRDEEWEQ